MLSTLDSTERRLAALGEAIAFKSGASGRAELENHTPSPSVMEDLEDAESVVASLSCTRKRWNVAACRAFLGDVAVCSRGI